MMSWKRDHLEAIRRAFGCKTFDTRQDLRIEIGRLLNENKTVHSISGPDNDYRFNPEATEAEVWKARVLSTIIPNSNKIILLVESNLDLLTSAEVGVVEQFRYHVKGLVLKHLDDQPLPNIRFPEAMNELAK
ncbi:hypothetical protein [Methylobacterium sp. E-045]|uniref:hypothetical protein n=1 Tax=Methylobacterium sp. E-045 TaxID=2836575 RepID=UPI001FB8E26E|nr:hypothetical protein [Methylobacterium sp. E-045]MCJ2130319.1 hypothetical protein [Methylobacterium sp. E-045]